MGHRMCRMKRASLRYGIGFYILRYIGFYLIDQDISQTQLDGLYIEYSRRLFYLSFSNQGETFPRG